MASKAALAGALTDGTGVSVLTSSKAFKDFVADFLMTGAAAVIAVNITNVNQAAAMPTVVLGAVLGALIRTGYRAALRWATS